MSSRSNGSGDFIFYNDQHRERFKSRRYPRQAASRCAAHDHARPRGGLCAVAGERFGQRCAGYRDRQSHRSILRPSAALTHRFGRLSTTLQGGAVWQYYDDVELAGGGEEDNSDREYVEPEAALRVGYEASPALQPFVEAAYPPRFHFEDRDRNGFDRNSDGYRVEAGVAFEPSPIWSGELALDLSLARLCRFRP